ncbi:hypothetical protein TNCV_3544391 [Trichonephila clavipes]|nr:hypothetical protein TNCV_3544391 [Trichonephila clavipes]
MKVIPGANEFRPKGMPFICQISESSHGWAAEWSDHELMNDGVESRLRTIGSKKPFSQNLVPRDEKKCPSKHCNETIVFLTGGWSVTEMTLVSWGMGCTHPSHRP